MTIKDYYAFLREVKQLHYPNSSLKDIKKMKNVKDAYECKKIEEECRKCHNANHFQDSIPKTIPKHQPTKKPKSIPPTPKSHHKSSTKSISKIPLTMTVFVPKPTNMNKIQKYTTPNKYIINDVPYLIKNLDKPNIDILLFQSEYFKNIVQHTNLINEINSIISTIKRSQDVTVIEEFLIDNNVWTKFKREAFTYWSSKLPLKQAIKLIDTAFNKFIKYLMSIITHVITNIY